MKKELIRLRERMKESQIDAYLIMTDDFHGSEYVGDYFKCREYISGFTGSAGSLVALVDQAALWTDGRYFLQAEEELKDSGIELYKSGQPEVPSLEDFLCEQMKPGQVLGFDGRCVMADKAESLREKLIEKDILVNMGLDLVGEIWNGRPPLSQEPAWLLDTEYAGESRRKKIERVREYMKEKKADVHILASLEDICWLLNVRGNDVECTPVTLGYLLINAKEVIWYVQEQALTAKVREALHHDKIKTASYNSIFSDIAALPEGVSLLYDRQRISSALYDAVPDGAARMEEENPTLMMKAVKNPTEIKNEKLAHLYDGIAVTKWIFWLKNHVGYDKVTEMDADRKLEELRKEQPHYLGRSFSSIVAYKEHGAVIHYSATEETNCVMRPESFVLADVGGHYLYGTTDTTRTIALGALSEKEKELYTAVLRGHIRLADAVFLEGATGITLDGYARAPLWEKGYDYNHGTGHGVGYLLGVHEGPNHFRRIPSKREQGECVIKEGMVTSDEPGVYLENEFGIRLENIIVCIKKQKNEFGQFLGFEPLTMVPFDLNAVIVDRLEEKEKKWLNAYHHTVYETLSPHLSEEEARWLRMATRQI